MNERQHRRRERATRVYRLLLRLYPRAHRRAFGEQMLQAFWDHYRDAVESQGEPRLYFWLGVLGDAGASLINEHRTALGDGRWLMKKLLLGLLVVGLAAIGLVMVDLPARAPAQNPGLPISDPIRRPVLQVAMLLITLGLYAALVASIVQVVRNTVSAQVRPSWLRLGLALGGILSLYALLVNVLAVMVPNAGSSSDGFLVLTLPLLLVGVVGLIGGYAGGTTHTGALAGLLAGVLYVLVVQLSWVLVLVVAWPAITHHLVASGAESDFQRLVQATGRVPDLGTFVNVELFEDGIGFPIAMGLIGLALEGLCATLGGVIGRSLRQADVEGAASAPAALPVGVSARRPTGRLVRSPMRPIAFLLGALALDLLVWMATVEFNAVGGTKQVLGPGDLGNSFATQLFSLWLLGFLVVLAFVLVGARRTTTRPTSPAVEAAP